MLQILQKKSNWHILLIYLFIAILLRLPFFFRDYIDHDESTFIIMGQALADGHLPFTKFWDLKPPLVFYFFGGVISIFGKSLFAIRLIGSLLIGITAWYTFRLSYIHFDKKSSFFAGLISIYLLSLFGAMQGVMSEHLAVLPLIMGMFYLSQNAAPLKLILIGFLFGLSIMFRLNLAYAIIFIYAYAVFINGIRGISTGLLLTIGSFLAFALCIAPYYITENLDTFYTSVLKASLAYSNVSFDKMLKTLPLMISFLLLSMVGARFLKPKGSFTSFMLIIVMIIGQTFMFFKSGKINGHYLIQIFPFLAILFTAFISRINLIGKAKKVVPNLLVILFILLPVESYMEIATVIQSKRETGSYYNGEGHTIPRYLVEKYGTKLPQNIIFLNEHIGYWILNTKPPCAIATHPSNIFRKTAYPHVKDSRSNALLELNYIFNEQRPNFVVYDHRRIPMDKKSQEYAYFQKELKTNYTLDKVFGIKKSVVLYKRNILMD